MGKTFYYENMTFKVPASVAGRELERLNRAAGGGMVTPAAVVDAARPERAPLHPAFTWDDAAAAELYRQEEARHLIRSVRIESEDGDGPAVRYVNVEVKGVGSGYVTTVKAMGEDDLRRQVVSDAISFLRGAQKRYQSLTELARVFGAMDREIERVESMLAKRRQAKGRRRKAVASSAK